MKKHFSEAMGDFLAGRGFYIALALCLAAIGASGYYLYSLMNPAQADTEVSVEQPVELQPDLSVLLPDTDWEEPDVTTGADEPADETLSDPGTDAAETAAPADAATSSDAAIAVSQSADAASTSVLSFQWPLSGEVLTPYSQTLSYNGAMGDWRTHEGIDIVAAEGTQVAAIADGVVSSVEEDVLMGCSVTVDHGDGLTSVYANLQSAPTVAEGDAVSCGTLLGAVGATAGSEADLPAHLHLALYLAEEAVNPLDYLPV